MTLREIYQALADGKKIRDTRWKNGEYVYLSGDGTTLYDQNHSSIKVPFSIQGKFFKVVNKPKEGYARFYKRQLPNGDETGFFYSEDGRYYCPSHLEGAYPVLEERYLDLQEDK